MPLTPVFRRGLVVGKFSPLHRGHEYLIDTARRCCSQVFAISYSNPEYPDCEAKRRKKWLAELFPDVVGLVIDPQQPEFLHNMPEGLRQVPLNSAASLTHRLFCGALCTHQLGITVDAVFTSEDYGHGFAEELTHWFSRHNSSGRVNHILVDRKREKYPVSGTAVRADVHGMRKWLPQEIYTDFVRRILFLGGESSGKSSLAEALAEKYGTAFVAEYGRELWEQRQGLLSFPDMLDIAREQIARETLGAHQATRYLFCDTSPLTTLFYSRYLFGKVEPELLRLAERHYDLVLLLEPDFPFVQDGTRQPESFRRLQHDWYRRTLTDRGIRYLNLAGSFSQRKATVAEILASTF